MRNTTPLVLLVTLLLIVAAVSATVSSFKLNKLLEEQKKSLGEKHTIHLKAGNIDGKSGGVFHPKKGFSKYHSKYYGKDASLSDEFSSRRLPVIIKFKPSVSIDDEFVRKFERRVGINLGDYIPHNSFISRVNELEAAKTRAMSDVEFIVEYTPEYKVSSDLLNSLSRIPLFSPLTGDSYDDTKDGLQKSYIDIKGNQKNAASSSSKEVLVSINLVRDNDRTSGELGKIRTEMEAALKENDITAKIVKSSSTQKLLMLIDASQVAAASKIIAHHPETYWVEPLDAVYSRDNADTRSVIQSNVPGKQPFTEAGLTGKDQIIAYGDSGLDYLHCFFYDDKEPIPFVNSSAAPIPKSNHRKVAAYSTFMDGEEDSHGHGTHVAGTLAGASFYKDAPISKYHGMASDAKLAVFDIGCTLKGGCSCSSFEACPCDFFPEGKCPSGKGMFLPYDLYNGYFAWAYKAGARIHSNSIGGTIGKGYGTSSVEMDQFMYDHPDFLIIWSAGNEGKNQGYMTLSGPVKQSKNAIIVGASMNSIDSWSDLLQNYRNYTERGALLKKKIDKQGACSCANTCHTFECEQAKSLTSEEGCCDFFEDCQLEHPDAETNPLANVVFGCCRKCALKHLLKDEARQYFDVQNIAPFSSLGPAIDGRIKPDLVAPGYYVLSARTHMTAPESACTAENAQDGFFSIKEMAGTSMATPAVAGTAAVIRDYFAQGFYPSGQKNEYDSFEISAALIKAILVSSARPMKGVARVADLFSAFSPAQRRFFEGHGLINLSNSLYLKGVTNNRIFVTDKAALSTGVEHIYTVDLPQESELSVTLAWTDPAGSPIASIALVNDLDLTVISEDEEYFVGNAIDRPLPDRLNNLEKVLINAKPKRYFVKVSGFAVPKGPQTYALVINAEKINPVAIGSSMKTNKF